MEGTSPMGQGAICQGAGDCETAARTRVPPRTDTASMAHCMLSFLGRFYQKAP